MNYLTLSKSPKLRIGLFGPLWKRRLSPPGNISEMLSHNLSLIPIELNTQWHLYIVIFTYLLCSMDVSVQIQTETWNGGFKIESNWAIKHHDTILFGIALPIWKIMTSVQSILIYYLTQVTVLL